MITLKVGYTKTINMNAMHGIQSVDCFAHSHLTAAKSVSTTKQ